jgi:hypothetical protein
MRIPAGKKIRKGSAKKLGLPFELRVFTVELAVVVAVVSSGNSCGRQPVALANCRMAVGHALQGSPRLRKGEGEARVAPKDWRACDKVKPLTSVLSPGKGRGGTTVIEVTTNRHDAINRLRHHF